MLLYLLLVAVLSYVTRNLANFQVVIFKVDRFGLIGKKPSTNGSFCSIMRSVIVKFLDTCRLDLMSL